jgi:hypothetical protein
MSPEAGRWIMVFASIAALVHLSKIIALYHLLWCKRERGAFKPMRLFAIQFLIAFLVLLPYQDPKASKAMNRFLLWSSVLMYISWIALACIIGFGH